MENGRLCQSTTDSRRLTGSLYPYPSTRRIFGILCCGSSTTYYLNSQFDRIANKMQLLLLLVGLLITTVLAQNSNAVDSDAGASGSSNGSSMEINIGGMVAIIVVIIAVVIFGSAFKFVSHIINTNPATFSRNHRSLRHS